MKKLDIRSILIGVLCTALVFVLIGAKSQNENLGDIVVNSIKVLDDGTGGFLSTYNADGIKTSYLGTAPGGSGKLQTYNADGIKTSYLGTGDAGIGFLKTFNKHGVSVGYFGSNTNGNGIAVLYDRYGDIGWGVDGKQ
jgi:hypothetical protein